MKALIIDDSNTLRRIELNELNQIGFTDIVHAGNGDEGIQKLKQHMPFNLILLDINMPVKDGLTTLKEIRNDQTYKDVKIVMVTSEAENTKVLEALRSGANDYIIKPFESREFKKRILALV